VSLSYWLVCCYIFPEKLKRAITLAFHHPAALTKAVI